MAILWERSLVPWTDPNGNPYSGLLAYFYSAGTSTPIATYVDGGLSVANDFPVVANANGAFGPIFLQPDAYRLRLVTADGSTLWDLDNITPPEAANTTPPDSGDTDPTLLWKTGMWMAAYGTGAFDGFVRMNGKTIGDAASGATERANTDCEDLFEFLWAQDANLTVSSGRGGTAAGDWAAGKTIVLPSGQNRTLIGLLAGGADPTILDSSLMDNSATNDTLGATVGASTHALTTDELASHTHTAHAAVTETPHSHTFNTYNGAGTSGQAHSAFNAQVGQVTTDAATTGLTVAVTNDSAGSGDAHLNMQPSLLVTFYLHL